jgi:hypothetical protein
MNGNDLAHVQLSLGMACLKLQLMLDVLAWQSVSVSATDEKVNSEVPNLSYLSS